MAKSNLQTAQALILEQPWPDDIEQQLDALYQAEPAGPEKHMIGMLCGVVLQNNIDAEFQQKKQPN